MNILICRIRVISLGMPGGVRKNSVTTAPQSNSVKISPAVHSADICTNLGIL